ncbi:DUF3090 domain-containing protein [Enemella sp. A6]|uniref:DUF3090 domain-containing protein n=1 Tax=Enemella sp. A6 TaxID=3440152 RepID=UPI003EBAA8B7
MASVVYHYDEPDRFVAGTVGEPGARTFFLQARQANRITSVVCEKEQVVVLAEHIEKVLNEIQRRTGQPDLTLAPPQVDNAPLDVPIDEEFRVGTMTIAYDADEDRLIIEMFSTEHVDEAAEEPDFFADETEIAKHEAEQAAEAFVVRITKDRARDFVARAQAVVSAGRPPCPFCAQPLEPAGHVCPRANGYRRALF